MFNREVKSETEECVLDETDFVGIPRESNRRWWWGRMQETVE